VVRLVFIILCELGSGGEVLNAQNGWLKATIGLHVLRILDYISQQLLEAHLDPIYDAASRRPEVIDVAVSEMAYEVRQHGIYNIWDKPYTKDEIYLLLFTIGFVDV